MEPLSSKGAVDTACAGTSGVDSESKGWLAWTTLLMGAACTLLWGIVVIYGIVIILSWIIPEIGATLNCSPCNSP
jgi:hypothetical protein